MRNIRREITKQKLRDRDFYDIRSILGNENFHFLLGRRKAGKSYSVTKSYVDQSTKKDILDFSMVKDYEKYKA